MSFTLIQHGDGALPKCAMESLEFGVSQVAEADVARGELAISTCREERERESVCSLLQLVGKRGLPTN